jgi:hypothetical protein
VTDEKKPHPYGPGWNQIEVTRHEKGAEGLAKDLDAIRTGGRPRRLLRGELDNCYEAKVSAEPLDKYADIHPFLRQREIPAGYVVILDAENDVVAIVPASKADALVEVLNEAYNSYPFREPEANE